MVLENILKERRSKRKKTISTILSIIVLSIASFFVLINFNLEDSIYDFFIGQKVEITGKILSDTNFPIYTHKIQKNKDTIYLKSSSINLNFFTEKSIKLAWEVVDTDKDNFIIDVNTIRDPSTKSLVQNNIYTLSQDLLLLDLSEEYDAYVEFASGIKTLYIWWENIFSIKTFVCSKINDSQNCQKIKANLQSQWVDSFRSYYGYTFFKNGENQWISFNWDNLWYIFTAPIDQNLVNISHMIRFIDPEFIRKEKNNLIQEACTGSKSILSSSLELIENLNMIKIKNSILDKDNTINECNITVDIYDNWKVVSNI